MVSILPVFAGMIRGSPQPCYFPPHSPRIRGDNLSGNTTEECIDGDIAVL